MERDSVQDAPPGARQLAPGQWRLSLVVAGVVIILFVVAGWIYTQGQGTQATTAFNDGNTFAAQGDLNNAISSYDQAIKLQPNFPEAYYRRGLAYDAKSHPDVAIADYTVAIQYQPRMSDAYYHRGLDYAAQQRYDDALADYGQAITLTPDFADAYYNRALVYQKKDQKAEAIADLQKVLSVSQDATLRQQATTVLTALGEK